MYDKKKPYRHDRCVEDLRNVWYGFFIYCREKTGAGEPAQRRCGRHGTEAGGIGKGKPECEKGEENAETCADY